MVFASAVLESDTQINGDLNGVNLNQLYTQYMSKSQPNIVAGEKVFTKSMNIHKFVMKNSDHICTPGQAYLYLR